MKGKKVFAVLGITSILTCSLSGCSLFQTMSSLTGQRKTTLTSERNWKAGKHMSFRMGRIIYALQENITFQRRNWKKRWIIQEASGSHQMRTNRSQR